MTQVTDQHIEKEIQAKGLTAPRITPEHIQSIIVAENYFTAADGVLGAYKSNDDVHVGTQPSIHTASAHPMLIFCVLVLRNGFTVTGESACASPENFDEEIGRKIARQNAVNKIWQLEGYLLKQHLYEQSVPPEVELALKSAPGEIIIDRTPLKFCVSAPEGAENVTLHCQQMVKINGIPFFLMEDVQAYTGSKGNVALAFEEQPSVGMGDPKAEDTQYKAADFSDALLWLKEGKRVCRAGWNGKDQYVCVIHAGNAMYTKGGASAPMQDCLGLKNAQGNMQPGWVPSMGDLMATDWLVYGGVAGVDEQEPECSE